MRHSRALFPSLETLASGSQSFSTFYYQSENKSLTETIKKADRSVDFFYTT